MKHFEGTVRVGLREKETDKLVAVYPEDVQGNEKEIEEKVKFWYYQQSCSAEDELRNLYVDVVTDLEERQTK
ncbi:MAG: hypothetical protein N2645_02250 [Clostridia bacterium]|nr:hypothetical protein [Clostridia bacterium]